ncbi:DUF480 domain-containing protein [Novipirellula artificiosorum]|uniref:Uncharacterized protein n=1 Tax=Novipirellula artificiosorum TaxID=2528016 RepID=A0A5C6DZ22_9BACT|nr:DUF480 domain-containing protein [Novipirellula artificiosorum]TWU42693.1 hypothetical protein Poly41_09930 [Novipirellula artificiosorum]
MRTRKDGVQASPHPTLDWLATMNEDASLEKSKPVPLSRDARRVLGVLVEKAKTTPDSYPLSVSGIISGSNQKSNRSPQLQLDEDDVLTAIDELKQVGAAREIQGSGRVTKYRHAAYEWLDVDSPGAAVMTELLLRGPQTLGEIRTRASRMYALDDLSTTQQIVDQLIEKDLIEPLTPPGRGQTFAHKLYPPEERQYLEAKIEKQAAAAPSPAKASNNAVDALIARMDTVNERIEALEKRLDELES